MMKKVHLFHFNKDEAPARIQQMESYGYSVDAALPGVDLFKLFKKNPPDAIVIDLSRSLSQGRDIGVYMRHSKATRFIPLLFVDGTSDKMSRVKELLPDAVFTTWDTLQNDLQHAIENPLVHPVVPASTLAGYAGTPLPKKLGMKSGMTVGLVHAPTELHAALGQLPADVSLVDGAAQDATLLLWFLRSAAQLEDDLAEIVAHAAHANIWLIWPKKTSLLAGDLTQQHIRERGLAAGLVDYKVCAVDATWSGLLFAKKRRMQR